MKKMYEWHCQIESGYRMGEGMCDNAYNDFCTEVSAILSEIGYNVEKGGRHTCDTATKGDNALYLHPMDISGIIESGEEKNLLSAFEKAKTFSVRFGKITDDCIKCTEQEEAELLADKEAEIKKTILSAFVTPKRNYYKPYNYMTEKALTDNVGFNTVSRLCPWGCNRPTSSTPNIQTEFVKKCFDDLVADGKIISAQTRVGIAYRTLK